MTVLDINPKDHLAFTKNDSSKNTRTLKLTNVSNDNVAFKVKTTAPKSYLVRPSSGTLRNGEQMDVQIIMQSQPGPAEGNPSTHRFLVQAAVVTSDGLIDKEMWSKFSKDDIQEKRLNVIVEEGAESGNVADFARETADNAAGHAAPATREVNLGTASTGGFPLDQLSNKGGAGPTKAKYEELVKYTLKLEEEKKNIEAQLRQETSESSARASGGGGYTLKDIVLVALVVFVLAYLAKVVSFGDDKALKP